MDTILAVFVVLALLGIIWFGIRVLAYVLGGGYEADQNLGRMDG